MIEVSGFTFKYGKKKALDEISLNLEKGEAVILAGANGAGKTTLLRALSGVLLSSKGDISIDGGGFHRHLRGKIAYIPASLSFFDSLRLSEAIRVHSYFHNGFTYKEIGGYRFPLNRKLGSLSRGEKTLFYLSLALSASPDYLLIDDVIHYLDPHLREIFLGILLQLIEENGLGVVIACQSPLDLEGLIDRVMVLDHGKIVLNEPVETLKQNFVRCYASTEPEGLPVVFKKEWQGMKELYIYPFPWEYYKNEREKMAMGIEKIEYLNLTEILRAYIGGEYDLH